MRATCKLIRRGLFLACALSSLANASELPSAAEEYFSSVSADLGQLISAKWGKQRAWAIPATPVSFAWLQSDNQELSKKQLKARCRKALSLPVRREVKQDFWSREILSKDTPVVEQVEYAETQISDLDYQFADDKGVLGCRGKVEESNRAENIDGLAWRLAKHYHAEKQGGNLKYLLRYLLKKPEHGQNAGALLAANLYKSKPAAALEYADSYIEIEYLNDSEALSALAELYLQAERFQHSLEANERCLALDSMNNSCYQRKLSLEAVMEQQHQEQSDDLDAYL